MPPPPSVAGVTRVRSWQQRIAEVGTRVGAREEGGEALKGCSALILEDTRNAFLLCVHSTGAAPRQMFGDDKDDKT